CKLNRREEAAEWFRRCLSVSDKVAELEKDKQAKPDDKAKFYGLMGGAARNLNRHEEAAEWFRRHLSISEEIGDKHRIAHAYHLLASQTFVNGDCAKALDFGMKALELKKELSEEADLASLYQMLGHISAVVNDFEHALVWGQTALQMYEAAGDREG